MKVLHVINGLDLGGAETLLASLLKEWKGQHHVVVLEGRGVLSDEITSLASSIRHVGASRSSMSLVRMVRGVNDSIRLVGPDIIHSHLVQSDLVSVLAGFPRIPRVTSIHVSTIEATDPLRSRLIARAVGLASTRFAGAIATSERSLSYLDSLGYACPRWVINNGTRRVSPVAYAQEPLTFLSLARFNPVKGHAILLQAFDRHLENFPDSRLICAGEGVSLSSLSFKAMFDSLKPSTRLRHAAHFVGPTRDIRSLHQKASALVISSVGNETFPMVGSEACMAGVPVITTDVGNASHFTVQAQAIAEPSSVGSLKDVMDWFAGLPPETREELSKASHQRAIERFDVARSAQRYEAVYEEVLRQNPSPRVRA